MAGLGRCLNASRTLLSLSTEFFASGATHISCSGLSLAADKILIGSFGENREFYQIFILNDPCCFSGTVSDQYESEIKEILKQLGPGKFDIMIDETTSKHEISDHTREFILEKILQ